MLRLHQVSKAYGVQLALRQVTAELAAGETLALFGANGAGKTTLLQVAALLTRPTLGQVFWQGKPAWADRLGFLRTLGFVGHQTGLTPELTALENLALTAAWHGVANAAEHARTALAEAGLGSLAGQPVHALSRGQRQQIALLKAFFLRPKLLLLDEPWSGLDSAAQPYWRNRLAEHVAAGGSAIMAVHDVALGLTESSRFLVLTQGQVALTGPSRPSAASLVAQVLGGGGPSA